MQRKRGTSLTGHSFARSKVDQVWFKGKIIPGVDSTVRRKDACGAVIDYNQYGKQTKTGWEIDHAKPLARGGSDDLSNLQPLQWENNKHKADDYPNWNCKKSN